MTRHTSMFLTSPLAYPFGYSDIRSFWPVSCLSSALAVPNDRGHSASEPHKVARLGRRQAGHLKATLSERDWLVLQRLGEHGYLTTDQVQRFVFTDHATPATATRSTRRTLSRLERHQIVVRLARQQGGPYGGSHPASWQLSSGGARLLRGTENHRATRPSVRWLAHCLATAETHLHVRDYARSHRLSVDVTVEPDAWRHYLGHGGQRLTLKPDLLVRLRGEDTDGSFDDWWFIEVDLGTESLPTVTNKCSQYAAYYASGSWYDSFGVMPRVLWVTDKQRRVDQIRQSITRKRSLPDGLFSTAVLANLSDYLGGSAS